MGEVVLSSGMELEFCETEVKTEIAELTETKISAAAAATGGCSWQRFLPKLDVRVLLVEADDSTRQIIAALLRKCSYLVATVSDGLKAWELLKGRSQDVDLVLTEVELPSISGYALLSLVMEHDICKNVPVIMMSSHDSVSTVYKCMLRGAADFLVKPVRKNELRNLWQHVWRRQHQSVAARVGPPDESMAQQKVEATAENNAISNHSIGYMPMNREFIEKGSDAQSSCTKPEMETEGADVQHVHSLSQPKNANGYAHEEFHEENRKTSVNYNEAGKSPNVAVMDVVCGTTRGQGKKSDDGWEQMNVIDRNAQNDHVPENCSREAIDLIGAFDSYRKATFDSPASNARTNKFDILPLLDLSLRRSHPSSSVNQVNDETLRLNHSDASAFSRYIFKPLQPRNSTSPSTCNQQKDHETNSEKQHSNIPDYNSDAHGSKRSSQEYISVAGIQPGLPQTTFSCPLKRETSLPIPVRGLRYENVINGFSSTVSQMYCADSGLSPLPSPGTASHTQSFNQLNPLYPLDRQPSSSQQFHNLLDQRISCSTIGPIDNKQGQKLENRGLVSSANDKSANSGFYNGKINSISVVKAVSDTASEECFPVHEGASHRSMQREAALTKFKSKRKERCFEKKVRYESRKKLAEQRPRVKGQFVRHLSNDQTGNSSAG